MNTIIEYENILRLSVFVGVLVSMALLESFLPQKKRTQRRLTRWRTNLSLIVIGSLSLKLVLPFAAVGMAMHINTLGWGLFNMTSWPFWLECLLAMVLLDLLIYWQHVASHLIPILWRFHKVHHADRDIDVTTGIRFHPIEILFSMLYKFACIALLGPAVVAVILFEVTLNACAMFNHANLRLSKSSDHFLRLLFVTPDMHRVHHSAIEQETNSNYGFSISLWDKLFKTYIAQPRLGHQNIKIGLTEHQNASPASFTWAILIPFSRK